MTDPTFTIEDNAVGLGFCVVAGRSPRSQPMERRWFGACPRRLVTVLKSEGGCSLIASQGNPIGYETSRRFSEGMSVPGRFCCKSRLLLMDGQPPR
jgi:hypothetical protein